jgi:hypothetical protein
MKIGTQAGKQAIFLDAFASENIFPRRRIGIGDPGKKQEFRNSGPKSGGKPVENPFLDAGRYADPPGGSARSAADIAPAGTACRQGR